MPEFLEKDPHTEKGKGEKKAPFPGSVPPFFGQKKVYPKRGPGSARKWACFLDFYGGLWQNRKCTAIKFSGNSLRKDTG
ncbi:MAG: hypothetical protein ACI4LH_02520, partial [Candidatus Heritagella sp.]